MKTIDYFFGGKQKPRAYVDTSSSMHGLTKEDVQDSLGERYEYLIPVAIVGGYICDVYSNNNRNQFVFEVDDDMNFVKFIS